MISVSFKRVNKKRPCWICGKTTYCGFSRDEGTSIWMRISAGARGLSRNGGNIHVHPEISSDTTVAAFRRPLFRHKRVKDFGVQDHLLGKKFNQAGENHPLSEGVSLARSFTDVPDRPTARLKFLIHEELDLAGPSASIKSPIMIP
jgi:hypothetical protein